MKEDKSTSTSHPFRIYLSHAIRGRKGSDATQEEIDNNINIAKKVGIELQSWCIDWEKMDGFPPINIYVPADHDEFVQIAYSNGYLTETEILACDCEIVSRCSLVILYGDYLSSGMKIERDYAVEHNIAVFSIPKLSNEAIQALQFAIHLILMGEEK